MAKATDKTEAQHTPGPWRARNYCVLNDVDMSKLPVTIRRICNCENPVYIGDTQAKANARLIAAAPDLLAALIDMVHRGELTIEHYHRARAAIAKAEGKA